MHILTLYFRTLQLSSIISRPIIGKSHKLKYYKIILSVSFLNNIVHHVRKNAKIVLKNRPRNVVVIVENSGTFFPDAVYTDFSPAFNLFLT